MKHDLKNLLISSALVSEEDIGKADDHVSKENVSFQEALIELGLIDLADLGQCLSELYGIPYKKLEGTTPSQPAQNFISDKCSRHWDIYPVSYNPHINLITIAVKDEEHALKINRIYRFLLDGQDVAFTVASEPELKGAIKAVSKEVKAKPSRGAPVKTLVPRDEREEKAPADVEEKKQGLIQWKTDAPKKLHVTERHEDKKSEDASKPQDTADEKKGLNLAPAAPVATSQSEEIMKSLSSAVSLLVTAHLTGNAQALSSVRSAARYCQLAAARLNFTPEQTVKLIIAGWLSALKDKPEVIKQFSCPYDLNSIIFSKGGDDEPDEALVLGLVNCYQDIEKEHPSDACDVNFVRRQLHIMWSAAGAHQDIIETFLQILMDEQFMNKFEHEAGTILLLDADGSAVPEVESPLARSGYKVHVARTVEEAQGFMYEAVPDFILAHAGRDEQAVLKFCKQTKADSNTAMVPIEVLVPDSSAVRGAEFLRAGADDFLSLPIDMELLYLKIEKQMSAASARPDTHDEGVTGSLADMSFCDMLQMLNVSAKSMDISIVRGDQNARVVLQQGSVIHCQLGDIVGENAFYQIMQWDDGKFAMKECIQFPEQTVTSSTMSLLMEGARLADEELPVE